MRLVAAFVKHQLPSKTSMAVLLGNRSAAAMDSTIRSCAPKNANLGVVRSVCDTDGLLDTHALKTGSVAAAECK